MNLLFLEKIVAMFIDKKRVIGWIGAAAIAGGAVAAGMSSQDVKDAVCGAALITPIATPAK